MFSFVKKIFPSKEERFHTAVKAGDIDMLKIILQKGVDIKSESDCYPFHYPAQALNHAAHKGDIRIVELLIGTGEYTEGELSTAFYFAASYKQKKVMELLLEKGGNPNAPNADETPLHMAAEEGDQDLAQLLITNGADVDVRTNDGTTPLYMAAKGGKYYLAQLLISHGAQVNVRNDVGESPLHIAAHTGEEELIELLLSEGANVNAQRENAQREDGATPLLLAAWAGRSNIVELLLTKGADINLGFEGQCVYTPIVAAAENEKWGIVELLIGKGANVNAPGGWGWTALHYVIDKGGSLKLIELLLQNGANVNAKNSNDWTPLHMAVMKRYEPYVKLLLLNGADVNARAQPGNLTPKGMALTQGVLEIGLLLHDYGAHT